MEDLKEVQGLARQKFWKELTADEKIEKLREIVKTYADMHDRMGRLEKLLNEHSHRQNGDVVIDYKKFIVPKSFSGRSDCYRCEKCREEVVF